MLMSFVVKSLIHFSHNRIRRINVIHITPQENGVAKRMNSTILERVRNMRIHVGLPLTL